MLHSVIRWLARTCIRARAFVLGAYAGGKLVCTTPRTSLLARHGETSQQLYSNERGARTHTHAHGVRACAYVNTTQERDVIMLFSVSERGICDVSVYVQGFVCFCCCCVCVLGEWECVCACRCVESENALICGTARICPRLAMGMLARLIS